MENPGEWQADAFPGIYIFPPFIPIRLLLFFYLLLFYLFIYQCLKSSKLNLQPAP